MDRWAEFQVFVKIAEEGSMTRAAEVLNSSTSGVSRQLRFDWLRLAKQAGDLARGWCCDRRAVLCA